MTIAIAVAGLLVGIGTIVCGITIDKFYAARGAYGAVLSDKRVSNWKGRLVFIIVGTMILAAAVRMLVYPT